MFDRLTRHSCRALDLAREEAQLARANLIGAEHLLLAFLASDCGALRALRIVRVDIDRLRADVRATLCGARSHVAAPERFPPFTDELANAFEFAIEFAGEQTGILIATEHMLMGMTGHGTSAIAALLLRHGVNLDRVRNATRSLPGPEGAHHGFSSAE